MNPPKITYVPCVHTENYKPMLMGSDNWFDSILIGKYQNKNILVTSNNGLSESMRINIDTNRLILAENNCRKFSLEKRMFSYTSSIYGNDFSFEKKFDKYGMENDTILYAFYPCMVITCYDEYIGYFADSTFGRFYGNYHKTGGHFPLWGWERKGIRTYGNKVYYDIYKSGEMLDGYYTEIIYDKHWGLVQFSTYDSLTWTLHYD